MWCDACMHMQLQGSMSYGLVMPSCFGLVTMLGLGRTVVKAIQVDRYRRQGWRRWVGWWLGRHLIPIISSIIYYLSFYSSL